jgi:iron complex transport system ATP-binding protein
LVENLAVSVHFLTMRKIPALELRDVSYTASGRRIIQSVNWTVLVGEHWAIVGPNGSGKTTLLKLACGYLWPNAGGEIRRQGKILADLRELRKSIGWVTSSLASEIPSYEKTIRTVVSGKFAQIGLLEGFGGAATRRDYRAADRYLDQMGCGHLRDCDFGILSQGEQQKVLIARARMTRPYLIVLDEPCAGMDPGARENFLGTLKTLGRQKRIPALIYVTHHVEEILPMFGKTLVLRDGNVLHAGTTRAVLKGDVLEKLYDVTLNVIKRKGRYWPVIA